MSKGTILTFACVGFFGLMMPHAKADEWNEKTVFTFSGPVEIPGRVLPAGAYVFKLLDSDSDRHIVEVLNKAENHVYGIFLAIPDYRMRPSSHPIITFEERAVGAPQAVKAWFYPGDNYGNEFVYPKVKAIELAKANRQPVPSMPNEMASNTTQSSQSTNTSQVQAMKQAPLKAQNPSGSETEIAEVFATAPAAAQNQQPPNQSANQPTNQSSANRTKNLPKTGSSLPLLALIGALCLVGAGLLQGAGIALKSGK